MSFRLFNFIIDFIACYFYECFYTVVIVIGTDVLFIVFLNMSCSVN